MALLCFSRDFSDGVLEVFSRIRNSFFFPPGSNWSNSIQDCMCPELNNSLTSNLQQAASSLSTAAVREEASAH